MIDDKLLILNSSIEIGFITSHGIHMKLHVRVACMSSV